MRQAIDEVLAHFGESDGGALALRLLRVPEHLDRDENRALAVKAIWALGALPGTDAREALEELRDDANEIVRENAVQQFARRGEL
ncbi:hypothetical protein [Streptomyces sp. NPDC050145]|uniref:hypothetical protein n=1 Tax=Streptomyces sp. NPDC050145 TaxID=3365602 RepID=UPI00378D6E6E